MLVLARPDTASKARAYKGMTDALGRGSSHVAGTMRLKAAVVKREEVAAFTIKAVIDPTLTFNSVVELRPARSCMAGDASDQPPAPPEGSVPRVRKGS